MAPSGTPFDSPDLQAALAEAGIAHKPGLAAEVLAELAPLLEAEGIDLENLPPDADLDTVNEALGRAVEQHNLGLFTPVSKEREQVLELLTEFADALTDKRLRRAEDVLATVEPEPTEHRPAASHVIGSSLGLLDDWYTDPQLQDALSGVEIPKWRGPARRMAAALIERGRTGSAFAAIDDLVVRHGGLLVFQAGAVAAAATILAYAQSSGSAIVDAAKSLFRREGGPRQPATPSSDRPRPGSAFGLEETRSSPEREELIDDYARWLAGGEELTEVQQADLALVATIIDLADVTGIDITDPDGVRDMLGIIEDFDDETAALAALEALHDYIDYRLDVGPEVEEWELVHDDVLAFMEPASPEEQRITEALTAGAMLSDEERQEALAQLTIVQGIHPLLQWLDKPRAVTATGGLRRVDIEPVAAMIGIAAAGAPTGPRPEALDEEVFADLPAERTPGVVSARSIKDVPALFAWWEALAAVEIIERNRTGVYPGTSAEAFADPQALPVELTEGLVSAFVIELLLHGVKRPSVLASLKVTVSVRNLHAAVLGEEPEELAAESTWSAARDDATKLALENAGILVVEDGRPLVPPALRQAVIEALVVVTDFVVGGEVGGEHEAD